MIAAFLCPSMPFACSEMGQYDVCLDVQRGCERGAGRGGGGEDGAGRGRCWCGTGRKTTAVIFMLIKVAFVLVCASACVSVFANNMLRITTDEEITLGRGAQSECWSEYAMRRCDQQPTLLNRYKAVSESGGGMN